MNDTLRTVHALFAFALILTCSVIIASESFADWYTRDCAVCEKPIFSEPLNYNGTLNGVYKLNLNTSGSWYDVCEKKEITYPPENDDSYVTGGYGEPYDNHYLRIWYWENGEWHQTGGSAIDNV
jgi:hypothetical protein